MNFQTVVILREGGDHCFWVGKPGGLVVELMFFGCFTCLGTSYLLGWQLLAQNFVYVQRSVISTTETVFIWNTVFFPLIYLVNSN